MSPSAGRSPRRSSEQVRASLLEAAAAEFAVHGYADTTMRGVAESAAVSLSVLHRHFESKAQLFSAALMGPFAAAFDEFARAWRRQLTGGRWKDDEMVREFVADLHRSLSEHRAALLALVSLHDADEPDILGAAFGSAFAALTEMSRREAADRAWPQPAAASHSVWLTIALVVGQVLMEPWAPEGEPGRETDPGTVVDLLSRLLVHGVRMDAPGEAPRSPR